MRQGVLDLRAFYASPLGRVTRQIISRRVRAAWGSVGGLDVLALGYATPFAATLRGEARRIVAVMPAAQGVEAWPPGAANRACLAEEAALPLPNALFDRVLAIHALEESDSPLALLREAWRVLAPSGRLIVAVTARRGFWARAEHTPFGHGRPFSRRQLEALAREAGLEPMAWTGALHAPPIAWAWRWAPAVERAGARLWPPFAGVILMEAVKQTFAVRAEGLRAKTPARPAFSPVPIGAGSLRAPD
ncbi:MAG: methyltransferase domain-containing protein [Caulobacteraceae bacterium]